MSEVYKKPQSPLQYDGQYFYPLTTIDQVILDEDTRLNAVLNNLVYSEEEKIESSLVPLDADTLGGKGPEDYAKAPIKKQITILANFWSSSAPYTQVISVENITDSDNPHIFPIYSDNLNTAIAQKEAWSNISRAKSGSNSITFYCFEEKPAIDIDVQIEVIQ